MPNKSISELCKKNSFIIKGGYETPKIDNIHEHLQILNLGTGVYKSKKGKGSYTRNMKHKKLSY